jgi:hypothetical protein
MIGKFSVIASWRLITRFGIMENVASRRATIIVTQRTIIADAIGNDGAWLGAK